MKVSVNWLKQLVPVSLSAEEIARKLTMAGLEVEEISPVAAAFHGVVVAEVKSVGPHPDADKLRVTEVDVGQGALLQIVCGAPNVTVGMRVPCALVGAELPGIVIKAAKLRGVPSNGMLCSARELGLSDDHAGLLALAADAPIGTDIRRHLDLDDAVLTLKMTPNRGDCLSMFGVARDLAAVLGVPFDVPRAAPVAPSTSVSRQVAIEVPAACGHYLGRVVIGINARAVTPEWMARRLTRAGFRTISPLVDITNYLTLERGRPMHAFDNDKLEGGVHVRFARSGEQLTLLNEQQVSLDLDALMICDERGPAAIGGVMGGLDSSVTDSTTSIFLEAAWFEPNVVRGKARQLGIHSDAAYRFERGVDPTSARDGIEYATQLALEICGTSATAVGPITEATGVLPARPAVLVREAHVQRLIGLPVGLAEMRSILSRLGCQIAVPDAAPNALLATPPPHRFDLTIEADFAEEIARIHGYENVPSHPPRASVPIARRPELLLSPFALRHSLASLGYQEVINYSFVPEEWETGLMSNAAPVRLANPIASQMSVMRTGLVGGLIETLRHNLNRGEARLRLFEIGRCFESADATLSAQPEWVAGLAYGADVPEQWAAKADPVDFFSVKGDVESLFVGSTPIRFIPGTHAALHPGRCADIMIGDRPVGWLGELHPKWQQYFELATAPIVFSLRADVFATSTATGFSPPSKMQAVRRDVAFVVPESVLAGQVQALFWGLNLPQVVDFGLFDFYRGANLESGKKSLAFRIVMQDTERTLTDIECDVVVARFVEAMSQEFGATLRK
jgi:phenylalanyl-tRNA synthetase beta chain